MDFDLQRFLNTQWESKTKDVSVPELQRWFKEGDEAVFTIRSLNGTEMAAMRAQGLDSDKIKAMFETIHREKPDQVAKAMAAAYLLNPDDVDAESLAQVYAVEHGVVEPPIGRDGAVALFSYQHGVFMRLVKHILNLSGDGYDAGKSSPSGADKTSATH